MEKVIQQQRRDCESAVINRGPYELADDYRHLQMSPDKWFSLNARQRESQLKSSGKKCLGEMVIWRMRVVSLTPLLRKTTLRLAALKSCLSSFTERDVSTGSPYSLQEDSIVEIPFKPKTCMIESDKRKPHYVVQAESGKVTCEDCPRYKSTKICPHSLAVAEKCSKLKNFLTWFKRSSHTLTATSYVTCDSAPTVGKKTQQSATSRRKGGRGQAINIVPRSEQAPPPNAAPPSVAAPPPSTAPLPLVAPPPFVAPAPFVAPPRSLRGSTALLRGSATLRGTTTTSRCPTIRNAPDIQSFCPN
ncbi:hypothetical protein OS493_038486 [Desmophyllum pertusum]|uniref:SWIM-type domain-containing protein n=1 Tax=Desmophyllum pertusum TaxID=174260 RepID=A0A9W9YXD7_9CNID|nr:hypothetical protein OS493_038486 [Desmophyllum pertusum]